MREPRRRLNDGVKEIWLFGTLFKCEPEAYFGAFYEFLHGFIFSTMPFWLGGLILAVMATGTAAPEQQSITTFIDVYWNNIVSTFKKGELLVFAISLLSPTLWLATHEPKGAQTLPHRRPLSTLAIIVVLVGAVLFAMIKSGGTLNYSAIFWISIFLTISAMTLRFMALVYHGYRLPNVTEKQLVKSTDDWMEQVDVHRKATS